MDPITQGALGAAAAQSVLTRRFQGRLWLVGALGGMAADLDILIRSQNDPLLLYYFHRQFSHSLIFIPIGGLLVGLFCLLLAKENREQWKLTILAATLGYATHWFIDTATNYGTVIFWPFTLTRYAWDIISIIDPILTGILVLGVICAAYWRRAWPAQISLALGLTYLGFGYLQHQRALDAQEQLIKQRGEKVVARRVAPQLASNSIWRSLYRTKTDIFIDKITTPLFQATKVTPRFSIKHFSAAQLPVEIQQSPSLLGDYNTFAWFTDNYMARSDSNSLTLVDLRFLLSMDPPVSLWGIVFPEPSRVLQNSHNQHIKFKRDVLVSPH